VPNFGCVAPGCLYRAGQPTIAGYELLVARGLTTVVNLRAEFIDEPTRAYLVLLPSKHPGAQYVEIPLVQDEPPAVEQVEKWLAVAADPRRWPLLVHSSTGEGRTTLMVALVRSALDGWSLNRICREAALFRSDWRLPGTRLALPGSKYLRPLLAPPHLAFLNRWRATHRPGEGLKEMLRAQ
jgi:protein tyrosine/serine phosphatase